MNGDKDLQVSGRENLAEIEAALGDWFVAHMITPTAVLEARVDGAPTGFGLGMIA